MGGFGRGTLAFVRDVATVRAKQLGAEKEELSRWLHVYKVRLSVAIHQALGNCLIQRTRLLNLSSPLTSSPLPLCTPHHTFPDILSWPRLPLDEDVPGVTQDVEEYDVGATLLSTLVGRGSREGAKYSG